MAESEMRFDRAMSDAEGLMWRLEKDAHLSSTFGTVTILDRAPDFDMFRRRVERALVTVPRLRQRVVPAPANLAPPIWADDPNFDIDFHLRRIACPKPGTLRQVLDLASQFLYDPLDRTRPLWQFFVVEGMRGGKAAIIQKMHHTITDGERGVELAMHYLDLERDAPEPPPLADEAWIPSDDPDLSGTETVREFLATGLRIPAGVARQVGDLLADPAAIPDATAAAAKTFQGMMSELSETDGARSPLWTARSLHRHVEPVIAPFRPTKDAAKRLGGTLNTAFLAAAAHGASKYHHEMGSPVESLRASMAISTRTEESGGNAFTLARFLVPTAEMPIDERFRAIQEATETAREASASAGLDSLAAVTTFLPTSVITKLARQQAQTVDFATSNVRGSSTPVYIAGAEILEIYPIGPLLGVAFNLTLMSYANNLDMAVNVDRAAVTDPELLGRHIKNAFAELAKA